MATPTTSVGQYIAQCQRVLEQMKDEGIKYEVRRCDGELRRPCRMVWNADAAGSLDCHAWLFFRIPDAVSVVPDQAVLTIKLITALTSLCYSGYGTNLEGPFPVVCKAIEKCHEAVSQKTRASKFHTPLTPSTHTNGALGARTRCTANCHGRPHRYSNRQARSWPGMVTRAWREREEAGEREEDLSSGLRYE